MSKLSCLVLAGLLAGANALAADSPASTAGATASTPGTDLEAQLAAARQKLEAAARDVAQLSSQLGQSAMARVRSLRTRAVLGLQLQVQPSSKEQGATVMGVSPGGPAAEAGIAPGDVIVALNGESTTGPNAPRAVVDRMAAVKPDAKVAVKVMRDGKPKEFTVTARAGMAQLFPPFEVPGPGWRPAQAWGSIETPPGPGGGIGAIFEGMELADLSPALGQYFGTDKGVLVVRVPREGEFLKLQDGDVILSIDGRVPENSSHATRILRSYQPGEKIRLKIMRQKKSMEVEGTLPERRRPGRGPGPDMDPGIQPPPPQGRLVPLGVTDSLPQLAAVPPK
ncbi:MAG TPA: PDZ domain-containing protein [Steroidobacteraceae bacterium]|jgi:predicted metalloprotease with PDZ domain|nr:PDZ domain-containing protein [Steroidobacteraceae bacterium]